MIGRDVLAQHVMIILFSSPSSSSSSSSSPSSPSSRNEPPDLGADGRLDPESRHLVQLQGRHGRVPVLHDGKGHSTTSDGSEDIVMLR
jgi:hypothetical protein